MRIDYGKSQTKAKRKSSQPHSPFSRGILGWQLLDAMHKLPSYSDKNVIKEFGAEKVGFPLHPQLEVTPKPGTLGGPFKCMWCRSLGVNNRAEIPPGFPLSTHWLSPSSPPNICAIYLAGPSSVSYPGAELTPTTNASLTAKSPPKLP